MTRTPNRPMPAPPDDVALLAAAIRLGAPALLAREAVASARLDREPDEDTEPDDEGSRDA